MALEGVGNEIMSLLIINNVLETFTPTQSGALATIIWEICRVAKKVDREPVVLTRSAEVSPFPWRNTEFIEYPRNRWGTLGLMLLRMERRVTGWRHLGHREYARRVVKRIRSRNIQGLPMLLINEPELAVYLRKHFPNAFIAHWFQNQLECKPMFRRCFKEAVNRVMAVSDFTARWIESYYGLAWDSAVTVYNGVDTELFHPSDEVRADHPVISFVGRTGREKAPDLLLKAGLLLASRGHRFSLNVIGSNHWDRFEHDPYQMSLETLAAELADKGITVNRLGHVSRAALPSEFRLANIHVVPSRWDEPFGLTTLEGMASGLAVVASRTGGTPEVVGDAGLLFERDSEIGLADCLESLILEPRRRLELGQRARLRARGFGWDRTWAGIKMAMAL